MKLLVTGHNGYIGSVLTDLLLEAGHRVVGLDTYFFEDCTFGPDSAAVPAIRKDIREIHTCDLEGFDAVVHLAALSNDPLGSLNADLTHAINYAASVELARLAKEAGVERYMFASSCSLYGFAGASVLAEDAPFNPITPYGISKVRVEEGVSRLADERFSPTFLRNATAYGVSSRLRVDVVVNNLVGLAYTTGQVLVLSDGTPWRPLVHVEDIGRAFLAVLHAPREVIHDQAFNVGRTSENYRVSELADMVREAVPGSRVEYAEGGGSDPRSYRVDCSKLENTLPEFQPCWTVRQGIEQLFGAFGAQGFSRADFTDGTFIRLAQLQRLLREGRLDEQLRWRALGPRPESIGAATGEQSEATVNHVRSPHTR
ncbi:MAG: SDR family oxidoreductase [Gemmatimonadales bacterium]|nr:SDR family oxidoreductase [Gemmatimonadales bacterium]